MVYGRKDIEEALARHMDISPRTAKEAVGTVFDFIVDAIAEGDEVNITGFGKFYPAEQSERISFGHATPAKTVPKFKAGKTFKEAVLK